MLVQLVAGIENLGMMVEATCRMMYARISRWISVALWDWISGDLSSVYTPSGIAARKDVIQRLQAIEALHVGAVRIIAAEITKPYSDGDTYIPGRRTGRRTLIYPYVSRSVFAVSGLSSLLTPHYDDVEYLVEHVSPTHIIAGMPVYVEARDTGFGTMYRLDGSASWVDMRDIKDYRIDGEYTDA